jgi:hypothetical protein
MKSLAIRILLLVGTMSVMALPAAAQYEGCKACRQAEGSNGTYFQYCGNPENYSWGRETCEFRTIGSMQFCRAVGNECYYFEVYG